MFNKTSVNSIINIIWFKKVLIKFINFSQKLILDLFMTFAPSLNYLFQAKKFNETKSSKGFSIFLCLVNLLSHTLKIFFWFGKKYKFTLLLQSILVINMQLYLIYLCLKFKEVQNKTSSVSLLNNNNNSNNNSNINMNNNTSITKLKFKEIFKSCFDWSKTLNSTLIWKWDNAIEYYKFYFLIIFILSIISIYLGINNIYYINIIGIISIFLEMLCTLPQIIELRKSKNPRNISKIMVFMWFSGNILKIYYNIINKSPIQLIIGSYIQVFFNIILIYQMIYYYKINKGEAVNNFNKEKIEIDNDKSENEEKETTKLKDYDKENNNV